MNALPSTHKSANADKASELMRNHARHRIPQHTPPLTSSQKPEAGTCACGGACPRCAGPQNLSSLVRSATEESGTPLPSGTAHRLQSRFQQTLPNIIIHRGPQADRATKALNTRAFAFGRQIFFAEQIPNLESQEGLSLLAHETAHVLQQGGESNRDPELGKNATLEQDAIRASRQKSPTSIVPNSESQGRVQREDPPLPGSSLHPFTSQGKFQLQLDPDIELEIFRIQLRQWVLRESASPGAADTAGPDGPVADPPTPADQALDSSWIAPEMISGQADIGALLAPFGNRGVAAGPGDTEVAQRIFQDRLRFVSGLPNLRDIVPGFARSWVPSDWRVKIAQSLTSMTIDSALKHDNPTATESADQFLLNLTGDPSLVPTYINLPSLSFDLF